MLPEWLNQVSVVTVSIGTIGTLCLRLIAALLLGMVVVGIYKATRRSTSITATFPATLVLLSILIAMVTQVIDDNVARAFSLVGALSVVRFRTVVRDTKDTVFVIAAVVVGMAAGTGQVTVALFGLLIVASAAALFRDRSADAIAAIRDMQVAIRLVWSVALEAQIVAVLTRCGFDVEPVSVETIQKGVGMELTYKLRIPLTTSITQLVHELSRLESVQSVELRKEREEA